MASGCRINADKFQIYALDTAKKLLSLYDWYYFPPSVLIHGEDVINFALLSIGELTEGAAKSRSEDIQVYRKQNTRKISRIATNTDLTNRLHFFICYGSNFVLQKCLIIKIIEYYLKLIHISV